MNIEHIKKRIAERLDGVVTTAHTDKGHFYPVARTGKTYPSVTAKLQILKDQGLMNYKMNRALDFVFEHWQEFTDPGKVMEILDKASKESELILQDAGDIGTEVHEIREKYFKAWIESGVKPEGPMLFADPATRIDPRVISALRALEKFVTEKDYIPIRTELLVYDDKMDVGGTLDDIGLLRKVIVPAKPDCEHVIVGPACMKCEYRFTYELVLMDLKTSNQFKDQYFFQVALYYIMFYRLTGIRPTSAFILKLSKENGKYHIEDLKFPGKLARYAMHMLKTNEAMDYIKSLRKDNQKVVVTL